MVKFWLPRMPNNTSVICTNAIASSSYDHIQHCFNVCTPFLWLPLMPVINVLFQNAIRCWAYESTMVTFRLPLMPNLVVIVMFITILTSTSRISFEPCSTSVPHSSWVWFHKYFWAFYCNNSNHLGGHKITWNHWYQGYFAVFQLYLFSILIRFPLKTINRRRNQ